MSHSPSEKPVNEKWQGQSDFVFPASQERLLATTTHEHTTEKRVRSKRLQADYQEMHRENQIKSSALCAWENGTNLDSNQENAF